MKLNKLIMAAAMAAVSLAATPAFAKPAAGALSEASIRAALDSARSFGAAAAHELRTPLTSLGTNLEILRTHPDHPERAQVLDALLAVDPALRVVLSSGFDEQDLNGRDGAGRAVGFIQKPYSLEALRAVLEKASGG